MSFDPYGPDNEFDPYGINNESDSEETIADAKHKLNIAIQEYCSLLGNQYVMNWVLAVDIATPQSERAGVPIVGLICPTDQQFVATRGLLAIANEQVAAR
jgi:hypothetical protein